MHILSSVLFPGRKHPIFVPESTFCSAQYKVVPKKFYLQKKCLSL